MNSELLFPKQADNTYHGHQLAKWLLMFYVFKSLNQQLASVNQTGQVAR